MPRFLQLLEHNEVELLMVAADVKGFGRCFPKAFTSACGEVSMIPMWYRRLGSAENLVRYTKHLSSVA